MTRVLILGRLRTAVGVDPGGGSNDFLVSSRARQRPPR